MIKSTLKKATNILLFTILLVNIINGESNLSSCIVPIPFCGNLKISLPKNWNHKVNDENDDMIPTFKISVEEKDDFIVLISPLSPCGLTNNLGSIKEMLEDESKMLLPSAVESSVMISTISSKKNNQISYFSLTEEGTNKQVIRCIAIIDEALINVTIFYNAKKDIRANIFLNALGNAEIIVRQ